jgi:effector-binding domain-containing protein
MLRNLILGLVIAVALFFTIGFVLPDKVHVQRSEQIQAPDSQVFALVNGFRQFDKWSPWEAKDPQMKVQLSGPPLGVGAHYEWSGNQAVGSGSQEIVSSTPDSQVKTRLKFTGFERPSLATFDLEPNGALTRVTWSLDIQLGPNPIAHYFGLLMNRQIGPDYERGLNQLRGLAEGGAKVDFSPMHGELVELKPQAYAYVSGSTSTDPAAIAKALGAAYAKVGAFLSAVGLKQAAPPIAITRRWDPKAGVYEFDAGIPVDQADAQAPATLKGKPSEVKIGQTYAGTALKAEHHGAYKDMGKTYELIDAYKAAYALQDNGLSWEQYISDPGKTPEAQLLTDIYVPVK